RLLLVQDRERSLAECPVGVPEQLLQGQHETLISRRETRFGRRQIVRAAGNDAGSPLPWYGGSHGGLGHLRQHDDKAQRQLRAERWGNGTTSGRDALHRSPPRSV